MENLFSLDILAYPLMDLTSDLLFVMYHNSIVSFWKMQTQEDL